MVKPILFQVKKPSQQQSRKVARRLTRESVFKVEQKLSMVFCDMHISTPFVQEYSLLSGFRKAF